MSSPQHEPMMAGLTIPRSADEWRQRGNERCKVGNYAEAVVCYSQSLRLKSSFDSAIPLLLNRSYARGAFGCFDAAILDAQTVLDHQPENTAALFRMARAHYCLRHFIAAHDTLTKLLEIDPKHVAANADFRRYQERMREVNGRHDFAHLLTEVSNKVSKPDMDRASWKNPAVVRRQCTIESHGRGLFAARDIKAGELLLVEKSFGAAFPKAGKVQDLIVDDPDHGRTYGEAFWQMRDEMAKNIWAKLHKNPSLMQGFADLYPGPDAKEEIDSKTGHAKITYDMVENRIVYNSFAFPVRSWDIHIQNARTHWMLDQKRPFKDANCCMGLWLEASYINHSCYPNVRRSFIGDMMIFRARQDIPAGAELFIEYVGGSEDVKEREKRLEQYGFKCECSICRCQRKTTDVKLQSRKIVMRKLANLFGGSRGVGLTRSYDLLEELESTYEHPAREEPRTTFVLPCMELMNALTHAQYHLEVVEIGLAMLRALGFEFKISASKFEIKRWGFGVDEVVPALADMWTALGVLEPQIVNDVERYLRVAYNIMVGEEVSFARHYAVCSPEIDEEEQLSLETKAKVADLWREMSVKDS